jgi:hypothetical protein
MRRREVTLQRAKGAKKLVLPISRAALRCLLRARIAGHMLYPTHAVEWCFPSGIGRIAEPKETSWHVQNRKYVKTTRLSPIGHALRNSFETLGRAAGIERFRIKLLMAHAVDQDITDSYTNVSALREQLREAAETVAAFIVRHAGCQVVEAPTNSSDSPSRLIPIWPVRTRLAARRPNCYMENRLNALSRVMLGHIVWWVWSKVQVLQLSE